MGRSYFFIVVVIFSLSSCASTQKFNALNSTYNQLQVAENNCRQQVSDVLFSNKKLTNQEVLQKERLYDLKSQVERAQSRNAQMQATVNSLSVVSNREAENEKQSDETIRAKEAVVKRIQFAISYRDSLNAVIATCIKDSLAGLNSNYIRVGLEGGNVRLDISNQLLFNNNFLPTKQADTVLEKIAVVLDSFPSIEFRIEAYADSTGPLNNCMEDNWDIVSQQTATLARIFQTHFNILPERISAVGKYLSLASSSTPASPPGPETSIVILMPWDKVFNALADK